MSELVLTWAYRYHSLQVREGDNLASEVRLARGIADNGDEALDCIEVWGDDGTYRRLSRDEVWEMADELEQNDEPPPEPKQITATISLKHPEQGWVFLHGFHSVDEAESAFGELKERLGERVRLEKP